MKPITREEQYLNKLTGEEQSIAEPITREEQYLSRLCGADNIIPQTPETRRETYLAALCGEEVETPEPETRIEQYMNFAAGKSQSKPEKAITREEMYWDKYQGGAVPEEKTVGPASSITVTDAVADKAKSLIVSFEPTQQGTPTATDYGKVYRQTTSPSGNMLSVEKLVGGTVAWNQLVDKSKFATYTADGGNVVVTPNNDGSITVVINNDLSGKVNIYFTANIGTSFIKIPRNHVFALCDFVNSRHGDFRNGINYANLGWNRLRKASSAYTIYLGFTLDATTTAGTYTITPQLIDLTLMFANNPAIADYAYSLETSEAGSGIAWLKSHGFIDDNYHAYNTGELMSVKASAHVIKDAQSAVTNTYNLDGNLELRGMPKLDANNVLYYDGDEYAPSGEVTRKYELRAYQSGDESLTDAITDGTNTVVKLATPTTEQSTAYTANETLSGGSQEFTDSRAVKIPVGVVGKARETYGFYMSANATITVNGVDKYFTYNRAGSHSIPYYGITFDAINGGGTNDWAVIQSYNGETLSGKWLSNMDVYAEGTTPTIGAQVLYKTDNPSSVITYGPPIEVDMQEGTNTISAVANIYIGSGTEPATVTLTYLAKAAQRVLAMNRTLQKNLKSIELKKGGDLK